MTTTRPQSKPVSVMPSQTLPKRPKTPSPGPSNIIVRTPTVFDVPQAAHSRKHQRHQGR